MIRPGFRRQTFYALPDTRDTRTEIHFPKLLFHKKIYHFQFCLSFSGISKTVMSERKRYILKCGLNLFGTTRWTVAYLIIGTTGAESLSCCSMFLRQWN